MTTTSTSPATRRLRCSAKVTPAKPPPTMTILTRSVSFRMLVIFHLFHGEAGFPTFSNRFFRKLPESSRLCPYRFAGLREEHLKLKERLNITEAHLRTNKTS